MSSKARVALQLTTSVRQGQDIDCPLIDRTASRAVRHRAKRARTHIQTVALFAPIILGGIAVTLGLGALKRPTASRPMAYVGIALGATAFVGNAATWVTNAF